MSQWVKAWEWCLKTQGVPDILKRVAEKHAGPILNKKARSKLRPPIRLPRGAKAKVKRVALPKLKKELDRVFSIVIRRRRAGAISEMGQCVTCGHLAHWKEMDAGHYQPRQDLATRWEEKNVHIQCKSCNGFRGGEPEKMAAYIDQKYGAGTAEALRAQARQPFRLNRQWLESRIAHYKALIGESSSPGGASPEGPSPSSSSNPPQKGSP
jgi:hypothetical protein